MRNKNLTNFERLKHITEAISKIERYSEGCNLKLFLTDAIIHDAVLMQFMLIGESITHVETDLLQKYTYPWHKVRSFRNLIAHEYYNIKLQAVWDMVIMDIPSLKKIIEQILKNEF